MVQEKIASITVCKWSPTVEARFSYMPTENLASLKKSYDEKFIQILDVSGEATMAIRTENCYGNKKAVIVCEIGGNFLPYLSHLPAFSEWLLKKYKADYVRVHTTRKGLVKLYQAQGYKLEEYILTYESKV